MEWLSVDKYGEYKITEAGRKNSLDNLKLNKKNLFYKIISI